MLMQIYLSALSGGNTTINTCASSSSANNVKVQLAIGHAQ